MKPMKTGKVSKSILNDFLTTRTGAPSETVVSGPAFGVDTAVVEIGNGLGLIAASDPLSLIPGLGMKKSAWLSVILPANDVATSGYLPQYAQFVLNLPETLTRLQWEEYWEYIHTFCKDLGISITGGHTGFSARSGDTLAGAGTMMAVAEMSEIKLSSRAEEGQDLIVTKSAALSSASILALSFPNYVKEHLGAGVQEELAADFYRTGIVSEVRLLRKYPLLMRKISAMHDVTEGGVLGAVFELCTAAGIGVEIAEQDLYAGKAQKSICDLFRIDPLRCVGAGSLLMTCDRSVSREVVDLLTSHGAEARIVGRTLPAEAGMKIINTAERRDLTYQETDPYWSAFREALEKNLN